MMAQTGRASPNAAALAKNGIISMRRTPWLLGCKVYVNGELIKRVKSVNTSKGFVLAFVNERAAGRAGLEMRRIYGYIEVDASDCSNEAQWKGVKE